MTQPIILCLSGWAQSSNSLDCVTAKLANNYQIINFDYSQFYNIESCFLAIKNLEIDPEIILGWSLGGQIATRLIAKKIFSPKLLILISAPFQFVKLSSSGSSFGSSFGSLANNNFCIPAAMPERTFKTFRQNFILNSTQTLEKFSVLMMMNDKNRAKELAKNLCINQNNYVNLAFWLDELGKFSCFDLNFSHFPQTIILHGEEDLVVHHSQAKIFAKKIIDSKINIIVNCGHCPHISHSILITKIICDFVESGPYL
jgi:pimeloyl-ACP methyl ester carboxylesterase